MRKTEGDKKRTKKLVLSSLISIVVLCLVLSLAMQPASAAFTKKAPISINNTGGGALLYYQMNLNVTYDSDMNNDFSDIRVKNETSGIFEPYWIEDKVNGSYANIWFNATSIPASSWCNDTYYLYYGDVGASFESNGTNTFDFFDDFVAEDVTTEATLALYNLSCHGCAKLYKKNDTEFWTVWHYCPTDLSGNTQEDIAKTKIYLSPLSKDSQTWVSNTSNDEEIPYLDKFGDTYYTFYGSLSTTNTLPCNLSYRTSSDGNTWSSETILESDSSYRIILSTIQINATTYWVVYNYQDSAGTYYLRYRSFDTGTGTFSSSTNILSSSTRIYASETFYDSSTDTVFVYYSWDPGPSGSLRVVEKTGTASWSSASTVVSATDTNHYPSIVKMDNGVFLLFYYDGNYDIKIMRSTDGINFTALKTLHSHASDEFLGAHVKRINSTHIACVYNKISGTSRTVYYETLLYTLGENPADNWNVYGGSSITGGFAKNKYGGTGDRIIRKAAENMSFAVLGRFKSDIANSGSNYSLLSTWNEDVDSAASTGYMAKLNASNFELVKDDATWGGVVLQNTSRLITADTYYLMELALHTNKKAAKLFDNSHTLLDSLEDTDNTYGAQSHLVKFLSYPPSDNYVWWDWILIRNYASPEPFASLGTEQTIGVGAYNITLLTGWNIIGWTDTTTRTAHTVGGLIGSNCTYLVERNRTTGQYVSHNMAGPESENNFNLERGWGYYIRVSDETVWNRTA